MTAIEPFADLSDAQVLSLAGGRYLRNEVFQQTDLSQAGKRMQMNQLANARLRLQTSLFNPGTDRSLAMPLLVNIALQRQACLKNTEAHLKSLGALFDQVCLSPLLTFFKSTLFELTRSIDELRIMQSSSSIPSY